MFLFVGLLYLVAFAVVQGFVKDRCLVIAVRGRVLLGMAVLFESELEKNRTQN